MSSKKSPTAAATASESNNNNNKKKNIFSKVKHKVFGSKKSHHHSSKTVVGETVLQQQQQQQGYAHIDDSATYKTLESHGSLYESDKQQQQQQSRVTTTNNDNDNDDNMKEHRKSNWIARLPFFKRMCDKVFDAIDEDGSDSIDRKELYSGLLLLHLQLGSSFGAPACNALDRKKCDAVFEKMDVDNSGQLDKSEFREVMMVLFSNVLVRVFINLALTAAMVPIISQAIVHGCDWLFSMAFQHLLSRNLVDFILYKTDEMIEGENAAFEKALPFPINKAYHHIMILLDYLPTSFVSSLPIMLVSSLLSMLIVPMIIGSVDEFFQSFADKRKVEVRKVKQKAT